MTAIRVSYDGTSVINIITADYGIKWTSAGFAIPDPSGELVEKL